MHELSVRNSFPFIDLTAYQASIQKELVLLLGLRIPVWRFQYLDCREGDAYKLEVTVSITLTPAEYEVLTLERNSALVTTNISHDCYLATSHWLSLPSVKKFDFEAYRHISLIYP